MKKTLLTLLFLLVPATAFAGGSANSLGIGAELNTLGGPNVSGNYDLGKFHVGASFGFSDNRPGGPQNNLRIGGRFYFHLHTTALADFGLGGELHIEDSEGPDNTAVEIAAGFQIRSFISTNVALSFSGGLVIGAADSSGFSIGALPMAAAGIHYYFF